MFQFHKIKTVAYKIQKESFCTAFDDNFLVSDKLLQKSFK